MGRISYSDSPMGIKLIDLFSGAGGLTLGFVSRRFCGGYESVLAIDHDSSAAATHAANFEGRSVCANIEEWVQSHGIPRADVVVGGPPCQGFSLLNKNRTGDKRRELWEPFLEVADRSRAKVFVMENVAELLRSPELAAIRRRASKFGFSTAAAVLNAADYGTPQIRKRTFVIGCRGRARLPIEFPPPPTHADPAAGIGLPPWRTVRDAIEDLPPPRGTEIGKTAPLNLHFCRTMTPLSVRRYRFVPPGGNRFDLQRRAPLITPPCWIKKTSGGTDLFGRLWWDRPSVTIRTEFYKPEKGRYLHPVEHRPITHREAARFMGFPDNFRFEGSKVEVARQIGNAVPPPLAGALGRLVRSILSDAGL